MVQQTLDRDYDVVGVCREQSVGKLDGFKGRMIVIPGATDDREVIKRAVAGCNGVLVVLVPRGVHGYSTGTAQAVLDHGPPRARLVFSSGWHITRDGQDVYSWKLKAIVKIAGPLARLARFADLGDQVEACRRVSQATRGGLSCAEVTSRRARVRACPCGAGTWVTHPREQHHAPRGLRIVHGGGSRKRQIVHEPRRSSAARRPPRSPRPC